MESLLVRLPLFPRLIDSFVQQEVKIGSVG